MLEGSLKKAHVPPQTTAPIRPVVGACEMVYDDDALLTDCTVVLAGKLPVPLNMATRVPTCGSAVPVGTNTVLLNPLPCVIFVGLATYAPGFAN